MRSRRPTRLLRKLLRLRACYLYRADLSLFGVQPSVPPELEGLRFVDYPDGATAEVDARVPAAMEALWKRVRDHHQDFGALLVETRDRRVVYYTFYIMGRPFYLREGRKVVFLDQGDVYHSAQRTMAGYGGRGMSQAATKHLYWLLSQRGARYAYGIVDKDNSNTNHILQKLGSVPIESIFFLTILGRTFTIGGSALLSAKAGRLP